VRRELYFAAFDRLYTSFQLFMQALFIAHRTYPLAYNRWIREQVEEVLGLPELYRLLPGVLEVRPFESGIVTCRAQELAALLAFYTEKVAEPEPDLFIPVDPSIGDLCDHQ
jgi:hypothetical protein